MSESKVLRQILALFALGDKSSGTTEAEMMAAISKARTLMARHHISEAEVQVAADLKADKEKRPREQVHVHQHAAYTRKIRNLAVYDHIVAVCVGTLTATQAISRQVNYGPSRYSSIDFVGTILDTTVASKLFIVLLEEVRKRARNEFGRAKWGVDHTSYAVGFATRMLHRAQQMAAELTPEENKALVLVTSNKETAIRKFMKDADMKEGKHRKVKLSMAYHQGYRDGASISLSKTGLGQ